MHGSGAQLLLHRLMARMHQTERSVDGCRRDQPLALIAEQRARSPDRRIWIQASRDCMTTGRPTWRLAVQKEIKAKNEQSVMMPAIESAVRPSKRTTASALDNEPAIISRQLLAALTVAAICGICCSAPCMMPGAIMPPLNVTATNSGTATATGVHPINAITRSADDADVTIRRPIDNG